jgi:catechol 2,3-dioxygenase-like lactoylglutathione lyase family enzyme
MEPLMPIKRLDHVNLQTQKLAEMISWYEDILGFKSGWRPNFPFDGAWLYIRDFPMVHLVEVDEEKVGSEADLKIEHFAFSAENEVEFTAHLEKNGQTYRKSEPPGANIVQYNIWDPDKNHIHIDFTTN